MVVAAWSASLSQRGRASRAAPLVESARESSLEVSALLWITAAIVQLAAVVSYYAIGFGVGFFFLQLFVFVTFGLTVFQIVAKRDG